MEHASPPRLMILKMVLENFKSYGGVKEIGPFHKCLSSVVGEEAACRFALTLDAPKLLADRRCAGPNGSGKSNVIDAMLFVFAKRANKLRLKKVGLFAAACLRRPTAPAPSSQVSDLIHRSAEYPDLDFARVTVYFQEIRDDATSEDLYTVVEGSQFTVTRTAHAGGTGDASKYYINERHVNASDVTTMLKARGIDLDNNRFLILQVRAWPRVRRRVFEVTVT